MSGMIPTKIDSHLQNKPVLFFGKGKKKIDDIVLSKVDPLQLLLQIFFCVLSQTEMYRFEFSIHVSS
jgi:hypothetical protein